MQETNLKLNVTIEEINVIMTGISKLPIEIGLKTFNSVDQQIKQQLDLQNNNQPPLVNKVIP